ncbi:hypothetical protein [uncultured Subdoligranulum sp.]|uniref:hypothetical protein n=1 Tax=uncultured Subdoligranulum sp. TaxID=512298 RepID=UPI002637BBFE|nr:hypothetical protein [uncultured Subdoligranulum sp.]
MSLKKRLLSALLAMSMAVSLCATAWAETGTTSTTLTQGTEGEVSTVETADPDGDEDQTPDGETDAKADDETVGQQDGGEDLAGEEEKLPPIMLMSENEEPAADGAATDGEGGEGIDTEAELLAALSGSDQTITLTGDIELTSMLTVSRAVTIDLGDHTISADETFPKDGEDNKNHLVDVTAYGVTITNGTLSAGANNNHTLNIWNADGVQLYKLTLDNTASYGGAPLVIGSSDVTIGLADSNDDTVTVVAGQNSWYGINLDSRDLEDNAAYLKVQGKLLFQGVQKSVGIYVENNYGDSADDVTLELADGTSFTNEGSNVDEYVGINAAPKDSGFAGATLKGWDTILGDVPGAVAQNGEKFYGTVSAALADAGKTDGTVQLLADSTERLSVPAGTKATLELGGHTLTLTNKNTTDSSKMVMDSVVLSEGASLKLQNGKVVAKEITDGTAALFNIQKDSSIYLNNVQMDTTGTALFPQGNAARVEVTDSTIDAGIYAVGTNAATSDNYNVKIVLKDSTFSSKYGYQNNDQDGCTVMINVPGTLEMDGCTVLSNRQGVFVRGGTVTIKNSSITTTGTYTAGVGKYLDGVWSSGNEVPMAALVVGNRVNEGGAYAYPATCTVENTTIISQDDAVPAIYTYGMDNDSRKATLTIDGENTKVQGTISVNGADETSKNNTTISAGYYTEEVAEAQLAEGKACNLLDALYEGVYAYQVGESTAENVEVKVEMAQPEVDGTAKPETAGNVTEDAVKEAAGNISIVQESEFDVLNAVKKEANLDGQPLDSETVKNLAIKALEEEAADSKLQEDSVAIVVEPYLNIKPVSADDSEGRKQMTFDIELLYRVTATADKEGGGTVEATLQEGQKVQNPPQMDITLADVSAIAIPKESEDAVYVKHNHEGRIFYYMGEATCENGIVKSVTFTNLYGFSEFTVLTDTRYAKVKFPTTEQTFEYGPYSIGYTMPRPTMDGYTFNGWQFDGIEGTYTVVDEDLLTKLSDLYTKNGGKPIQAVAIFTQNPAQGGSTGGSGSSTTAPATPSAPAVGGSDVYYTCPACGYHNWTAGTDGYKCDHCGYVESVKQLSGYGNVKGVYEPKTSAAAAAASGNAAATSAIPQTSDELPLVCLVVVAIAALLGLGVTVVMKKRSNR